MAIDSASERKADPRYVNASTRLVVEGGLHADAAEPNQRDRVTRSGLLAILSGVACAVWGGSVLALLAGCGVKAAPKGIPFDLGRIPSQREVSPTEGWKEKGVRLAHERRYEEAVEAFKSHVVEAPKDFSGFNALAVCYKNRGNHAEAMRNFERALELADSSEQKAKILANIGNLYFSAEKPQVALGFYREAAAEYDKNPLYLVLIARTFLVLNENDRARKALAQAEAMERLLDKDEREEDRGLGSYLMALSYAALNDEEKVLKYVNRVLKINPKKYLPRIKKELSDETSLLYTLQDHPKIAQMMRSFSIEDFLGTGLKR